MRAGEALHEATPSGRSSPVCSVRSQRPGCRTSESPANEPRVRERADGGAGCHAGFHDASIQTAGSERTGWFKSFERDDRAHTLDQETGTGSSASAVKRLRREAATASRWLSLNSICEKTGTVVTAEFVFCRLTFSLIDREALVRRGCFVPQRFPTVRRVTHLGNGEHSTKAGPNFDCAFTESSKSACLLAFRNVSLLKLSASRQEKASGCNRNGATTHAHIANTVAQQRGLNVNAAGPEHLDTLFEDDGLVAGGEPVTHQPGDGAA